MLNHSHHQIPTPQISPESHQNSTPDRASLESESSAPELRLKQAAPVKWTDRQKALMRFYGRTMMKKCTSKIARQEAKALQTSWRTVVTKQSKQSALTQIITKLIKLCDSARSLFKSLN